MLLTAVSLTARCCHRLQSSSLCVVDGGVVDGAVLSSVAADTEQQPALGVVHAQPRPGDHRAVRPRRRRRHVPDRPVVGAADRLRRHGHGRRQQARRQPGRHAEHHLAVRVSHPHRTVAAVHRAHLRRRLRLREEHLPRGEYAGVIAAAGRRQQAASTPRRTSSSV